MSVVLTLAPVDDDADERAVFLFLSPAKEELGSVLEEDVDVKAAGSNTEVLSPSLSSAMLGWVT